ncbi:MAG: acetyl-CoA carboxylase biotin carboxyl carrier protein [Paenibacillus macerans]|uniref:Biotin carboxyl carrier protein of acetyl-CoA carboxylase n=1 Tax=Paenibacillus macerans TaxID=44252 RepID=A0A090ZDN9_PAEMA|nr:acetyl-CoA carboxylase biotin carboxyl carrier protein [Paenibacillus macerans]KFN09424.1 acetyl-CoA carboxylase, biotin carboxyl carrier protein [Paenibacillus macerans]MBS5909328.1 acetyl-CoA carboxylase biotin carboxyl carrier protein [Paenibacillus macerans]MDU7472006.1 acetyl-CoA carboxylase biotin carboxyl carrier protein [Paenibacillus macerans]MEC0137025.1 acetyl-CoA carboxylase biotin carboxyl carrier protein [Paenibacillus macerans]MEC0152907.1 acetyl-CoA carboxylase biotin carbox
MFNLNEIKELIELVDKTSIQEVEIENEGARLCIRKPGKSEIVQVQPQLAAAAPQNVPAALAVAPAVNEPAAQPAKPAENAANLHTIASPMVGTFYRSSSPDAQPYVNIGDKVGEKTTVCIIEAMKLMNELEAEVKGEIIDILVENGQLVEYGQPLFLVKPE